MADPSEKSQEKACDRYSPDMWQKSRCKMCFLDEKSHATSSKQQVGEKKTKKKLPSRLALGHHATSPDSPSKGSTSLGTPSRPRTGSDNNCKRSSPAPPVKAKPKPGEGKLEPLPPKQKAGMEVARLERSAKTASRPATCQDSDTCLGSTSDEEPHRTVLLIGKTGGGKSTVANVLAGAHLSPDKQETFKEGHFGVSETDDAVLKAVKVPFGENVFVTYHIVDTIGIGDTSQPPEVVLMKLARACTLVRNGINQIFFVTAKRFTAEEEEAFNIMRSVIFNPDVCQFITIVKTNFPKFSDFEACQKDIKMMTEGTGMRKSVKNILADGCAKIVHVDNPGDDNPDWTRIRSKSRQIMLTRLEQCDEVYCPDELKKMKGRVGKHLEEGEHLGRDIKALKEHFQKEKEEQEKQRQRLEAEAQRKAKEMDHQQRCLQAEVEKGEREHQAALERVRIEVDEREKENARKMADEANRRTKAFFEEQQRLAKSIEQQQHDFMKQQQEMMRKQQEKEEGQQEALEQLQAEKEAAEERAREDVAKLWQENAENRKLMEKSLARQEELEEIIKKMKREGVFSFVKRKIFG